MEALRILDRQKRTKKELMKGVRMRQRTVMDREREACGGDPRDRNEERKTDKGWGGGGVNRRKVKEETESQGRKIRREKGRLNKNKRKGKEKKISLIGSETVSRRRRVEKSTWWRSWRGNAESGCPS